MALVAGSRRDPGADRYNAWGQDTWTMPGEEDYRDELPTVRHRRVWLNPNLRRLLAETFSEDTGERRRRGET